MSDTHMNAYMQDTSDALLTALAAVQDAQKAFDLLRAKVASQNAQPVEPLTEASTASDGESQSKKKDVKYK